MIRSALATTLLITLSSALSAAEPVTNLKIGDPERRELSMPLSIDTVIDTRRGENITVTEVA